MENDTMRKNIESELNSNEYNNEYLRHIDILNSFMRALVFIRMNCSRNKTLKDALFCLSVIDDLLQSLVAIKSLSNEGIRNTCRRELRYIIELSIKACLISQKDVDKTIEEKISVFRNILRSTNISMMKNIDFFYFADADREYFISEASRFYGTLCLYVHASPEQIKERLELDAKGVYIGHEGTLELKELNDEIGKALYIALILFFHAIPQWCVGDYLVESNGCTVDNYFTQYRLVSVIDEHFDYKHERQSILSELQSYRHSRICY